MNKQKNNLLIPVQICSILLLVVTIAASAQAQTPTAADYNRGDAIRGLALMPRCKLSLMPSGFTLMPESSTPTNAGSPAGSFNLMPLASGTNLQVLGSGTLGRLTKWTGLTSSNSFIGDSTNFEDKFGRVGIGTDSPASRLTVAGLIEPMLGGLKFPYGTLQTTAGLASIFHDTTLQGNGTASSPLRVSPLRTDGTLEGNGFATDYDIAMTSAWSSRLRAGFGLLRRMDEEVIRAFEQAWVISGGGSNGRESVVLIFLTEDGSYRGKSLGFRSEYKEFRFTWDPAAVAVVHTHPNGCDPSPSEQDKRVAEKYDVPMFTITVRGMYVYDPATTVTSRVLKRLDWLKPSKWTEGVYRTVIAELFGDHKHLRLQPFQQQRASHEPACIGHQNENRFLDDCWKSL